MARSTVNILHLSDIHEPQSRNAFSPKKPRFRDVSGPTGLDLAQEYLRAIASEVKIHYIVISGDITDKGKEDGHAKVANWLQHLPGDISGLTPQRILCVPGNHDINRAARKPHERLASYASRLHSFPGPYIRGSHKPPAVDAHAIRRALDGTASELPLVIDRESETLFYLFDSTTTCWTVPAAASRTSGYLRTIRGMRLPTSKMRIIEKALTAHEQGQLVDAPSIGSEQLSFFDKVMKAVERELGGSSGGWTRIAVLHHHVGHIVDAGPEDGAYSHVLDAGPLKAALRNHAFHLVLHGHKHINYIGYEGVAYDTEHELVPPPPLVVLSAQALGGRPLYGDRGFNLVSIDSKDGGKIATISRLTLRPNRSMIGLLRNAPRQEMVLGERIGAVGLPTRGITIFSGRSVTIKEQYANRLRSMREGWDLLGLGLSSFLEDYGTSIADLLARARGRILLLDPSFPDADDEHCIAAIREREEEMVQPRAIRGQVAAWWRFIMERRGDEVIKGRLEVRLYSVLPMINIFRIDKELFFGPYLLRTHSRNTGTLLVHQDVDRRLFDEYCKHFEDVWEYPSTRKLTSVLTDEVDRWRRPKRARQ